MIEIIINGKRVEAGRGGLELDLVNPHLLYDAIPISEIKAPPFPATAINQQVFGYYHEPMTSGKLPEYTWKHYFNGELIREGYFKLKEASLMGGYVGDFDEKAGQFFKDFQRMNLREINFGTLPLTLSTSGVVTDTGVNAYCLPTIINSDYYGTNPGSYTGKMNDYASSAYLGSTTPKVPMFFVAYILKKIATATGVTIDGTFLTHATWSKLILYNTREVTGSTITMNQHLPDLTLEDFFLELRKMPNLKFDFQPVQRKLTIDFWEDSLGQVASIDWTSKAVKGEVKIPETRNRLQLGSESDNGDALLKDSPIADYTSPLLVGNQYGEIAKVISKFSTLTTDTTTGLAQTKQTGVTATNNQLTNNFSPRLLFWHGIVSGKPKATNELNSISLLWTGANGLAVKSWAKTEAARTQQFYLKKDFVLREIDLVKLDFSKKIHVNGVDYLIVNLNVDNPVKRVAKCLLLGGV